MKTCSRCNKNKPYNQYHKRKASPDGYYYYCKPCAEKRRQQTKQERATNLTPENEAHLKENYQFLRGQGLGHQQIAERLGYSESRLQQLVMQLDCRIMEPGEKKCWDTIQKLIERGDTFCVYDMPFDCDGDDFKRVVRSALRKGLVVKTGLKAVSHPLAWGKARPATMYLGVKSGSDMAETSTMQ